MESALEAERGTRWPWQVFFSFLHLKRHVIKDKKVFFFKMSLSKPVFGSHGFLRFCVGSSFVLFLMTLFCVQDMRNWRLKDVLYFLLGFIQSLGSLLFHLRMSQKFITAPDGKPKSNTAWEVSFSQNLYADVILQLRQALQSLNLTSFFFPKERRGTVRFVSSKRLVETWLAFMTQHVPHRNLGSSVKKPAMCLLYVMF